MRERTPRPGSQWLAIRLSAPRYGHVDRAEARGRFAVSKLISERRHPYNLTGVVPALGEARTASSAARRWFAASRT